MAIDDERNPRNVPSATPRPTSIEEQIQLDLEDDEEEALFSRDFNGQLIRLTDPKESEYDQMIEIKIDGKPITVPKSVPTTDSQGNIIRNPDGTTVPRATTIFDAALKLFTQNSNDTRAIQYTQTPIPILCHQEHMRPVAVCRICAVQIMRRDPRTGELKVPRRFRLWPACQHRVEVGMEVHTVDTPVADEKTGKPFNVPIRAAVRVLTELLMADCYHPEPSREDKYKNELQGIAGRFKVQSGQSRFEQRPVTLPVDDSSPAILVDHNNCVLCDRCIRACSEVKPFKIIGRVGKGGNTRIGFDLNAPMGQSDCRTCGECMISCPTGALTFRNPVHDNRERDPWKDEGIRPENRTNVTAKELSMHPLFRGISYTFLKWTEGSIIRRKVKKGEVLCEEGDFGNSAFVIERGTYDIRVRRKKKGRTVSMAGYQEEQDDQQLLKKYGLVVAHRRRDAVIIGEMSPLTNERRTASIVAHEDGELMQITRNVVHMLLRNADARAILDKGFTSAALDALLFTQAEKRQLFDALTPEENTRVVDYLRGVATLVRVAPGQTICREGERADDFYIVRLGFVKIHQVGPDGREMVLAFCRKGEYFGEVAFLSNLRPRIAELHPDGPARAGRRLASCTALDHVELVRIEGRFFKRFLEDPKNKFITDKLEGRCIELMEKQFGRKLTAPAPAQA